MHSFNPIKVFHFLNLKEKNDEGSEKIKISDLE